MLANRNGPFRWWSFFPIVALLLGLGFTAGGVFAGKEAGPVGQKDSPLAAGNQVYAYGLTVGNNLIVFDKTAPGTVYSSTAISGLQSNESIVGMDFRPATGELYGVGSTSRIYRISALTGVATMMGTGPMTTTLSGTSFGVDFNPVPDRIRIVSNTDQNLRVNPTNAAVIVDGTLAYTTGDPNDGANPQIVGAGYINSTAGVTATVLYDIDSLQDTLVRQAPPNAGTLVTVGSLGVNTSDLVGFDIVPTGNVAYAALNATGASTSQFYTVNLATGAATLIGTIGGGAAIRDIALPGDYIPSEASALYTRQVNTTGNVTSIDVTNLTFAHSFPGDLSAYLVSPSGTSVKLFDRVCGGTDWTAANTGFSLSNGAVATIGDTCPPGTTSYKPEGSLSAFVGEPAAGIWKLELTDTTREDLGTLINWNLALPGAPTQFTRTPTTAPTLEPTRTPLLGDEPFTDVQPGTYYYTGVRFLVAQGAISGYNDAARCAGVGAPCFRPSNVVTRGQFAKIVVLGMHIPAIGSPPILNAPDFTDVPANSPFYLYIQTARSFGLISGYSEAANCPETGAPCFRPNDMVSRGQIAKITVIASGFPLINPTSSRFMDVPASHVFYQYIETAACNGIVTGYADDTFKSANSALRSQVAKIVYLSFAKPNSTACEPTLAK